MPNRKHFYSFIFNHIFHSCKLLGLNPNSTNIVLKASLGLLLNADPESKPPEIVYKIQDIIRRVMKNTDPYREIKDRSTRDALSIYPELKSEVSGSSHPLKTAVRIAIAGNILDFGIPIEFNLRETINRVLQQTFSIDHLSLLLSAIEKSKQIMVIADNAGETVFDRVLIEQINTPIGYVVKGGPVINDATEADAISAGLHEIANIISCGAPTPGIIKKLCSQSFLDKFEESDLIISKGQANYVMLDGSDTRIFHLLQIKNQYMEHVSGQPVGSILVKRSDLKN